MSDTVATGVPSADQPASAGFRRIGPISALQAVLEENGLDGGAIIAREGIPPGALDRPENLIRVSVLGDLLAHCAEVSTR